MNRDRLYQALQQHFGHQEFRDGQLATIEAILAGQDTMAILPTGEENRCFTSFQPTSAPESS